MAGLSLAAWRDELGDDYDKEFILQGVEHGFDIISELADPVSVETDNHRSARSDSPLFDAAHKRFCDEVSQGNYVPTTRRPTIVSAIGVLPKSDGDVRLIHDYSLPENLSLNDYASDDYELRYQSVDDAVRLMTPGCFMAKVDLKSAYRSVNISSHSQKYTGIKWNFGGKPVYFTDTKLSMGSKSAPSIFTRLTQAVRRIMARKGYHNIVVYLDDFFICAAMFDQCVTVYTELIRLLRKLGFYINWQKVVDPCQRITFLGVELDSLAFCVRLPQDKLVRIRQTLDNFCQRKRASKRQLQALVGLLNWASAVVYGGRTFLRRILHVMNTLKKPGHKVLVKGDFLLDIQWWKMFMHQFNGVAAVLDRTPITCVYTDACDKAAGGYFLGDWFYVNFELDAQAVAPLHINFKETMAVVYAVWRWARIWSGKRILILSDNQATVGIINRGSAKHPFIMKHLRFLFWLSACFNFRITAKYYPGVMNKTADRVSRLHEKLGWEKLAPDLPRGSVPELHMSVKSAVSIFPCRELFPGGPEP